MTIWIVAGDEPNPIISGKGRLMRAGIFAKDMSEDSHSVILWSTSYIHYEKQYMTNKKDVIQVSDELKVFPLHSKHAYSKNISLKRVIYSKDLGKIFRVLAQKEIIPDIIYCSYPLIDLAYEAVRYGEKHNIPVVIDIRDFWPDIFVQPFPKAFQPFAKLGIKLLFSRKVSYVMKHADVVIGVIPKALEFAKKHGRELKPQDHVVYLSYDNTATDENDISKALEFWAQLGIQKSDCVVSYIGSIQNRIGDFDPVIEAARRCTDPSIKFVLCGDGYYLEELKEITKDLDNIILPGYRNGIEIKALLQLSTFGLLSYRNTEDFIDSLPNKFGEYLSEGLIILTSLTGSSRTILEQEQCGFYYKNSEELLSIILNLKNNSNQLSIMRNNALKLFHNEFDASVVYSNFYSFLESLAIKGK